MKFPKQIIIYFVVLIVIILGFAIFNISNESSQVVIQEDNINIENANTVKSGSFTEIDTIHKGSGEASIVETNSGAVLKLENNFKVTNGPDLFVYLSKNTNIRETKELGDFVSLGELKSSQGEQTYNLPENYNEYKSIVIWCRAFSVLFSVAGLS